MSPLIYPFQPYVKSDEFKPISMATVLKPNHRDDSSLMSHGPWFMWLMVHDWKSRRRIQFLPQLIVTNFKCHIFNQFLFQRFVILIYRKWRIKLDACTHFRHFASPKRFAIQMFEKTMSYIIWRSFEGYPKFSDGQLFSSYTVMKFITYDNLI